MTPIPEVASVVLAAPAPVVLIDTCNFQDLLRVVGKEARVEPDEISAAVKLTSLSTAAPKAVHLVVPELVPGEWADHAATREQEFTHWLRFLDGCNALLTSIGSHVGKSHPSPAPIAGLNLAGILREVAQSLLDQCVVLARDSNCVERALGRLTASPKRRPSHKKEIKDSINVEQCLALCSQLRAGGFGLPVVWVSSNTDDFADTHNKSHVHPDLLSEFDSVSLTYYNSLRAAVGRLRSAGHLSTP